MKDYKIYKIRMNCVGFKDIEVQAHSKSEARQIVERKNHYCKQEGMEFGGFITTLP